MPDAVLVGEGPSGPVPPELAFQGPCWRRLARLAGVGEEDLRQILDSVNLLAEWPGPGASKGTAFPLPAARAAAAALDLGRWRVVVLAGRRVAAAFADLPHLDYLERLARFPRGQVWMVLPHPSGVNRWWNDPGNVALASAALRDLLARTAANGGMPCPS